MKNRIFILFLIAILVITLSACQTAETASIPTTRQTGATQQAQPLDAEDAQSIAIADAGLKPGDVTDLWTEYDVDDGVKEFEVDFRAGDWEYDYTIHAETGVILSADKDFDPPRTNPTEPTPTEPAPTAPTEPAPTVPAEPSPTEPTAAPPTAERLSAEEAKAIALQHAELTADQVRFSRTEYDVDDGIPEYEIEFRVDDWEYDYTIHAETGRILSSDKEYDPPKNTPASSEPAPTEPAKKLTAQEAEGIALKHAGLTADQVRFDRTEYDKDNGVPEYEIEFYAGGWEYSYEIHAETGVILSSEKDRDD